MPLIGSAIRTGMPLVNPFYAIGGQVGPLRYYLYWYALCGVIGRTFHLPARAVMEGGCAWAAVLMFSTLFLLLKYLFRPAPEWPPMRWATVCVGCVCAMPVLGFDVLQAIYSAVYAKIVFPEIEWWRAFTEFSPSFHTFFLYAPHHTFGICAGFTGFLVLLSPRLVSSAEWQSSRSRMLGLGVVAGLCFGAMAGTSTYVSLFFAVALTLVAVDFAVRGERWMVLSIAVSGAVALVGALDFAHLILSNAASTGEGAFVAFDLRGWAPLIDWFQSQYSQRGLPLPSLGLQWAMLLPLYFALELAEVGVFVLVLIHRVRCDAFSRHRLLAEQRMQWWLALAFFGCALCLTSAGTIGTNDLGYHAGFALRVIAVLWSAPCIARWLAEPASRRAFTRSWVGRLALGMTAIGLATQAWQVVGQRLILLAPGALHRLDGPFPAPPHLAHQYEQTFLAWQAVDQLLPKDAIVLTNPDSVQRSMGTLYAGETPFGASEGASSLTAGPQAFQQVCRENHATAVLVSEDDPAWEQPKSWVWMQAPLYGNARERLYACTAGLTQP